MSRILAVLLIAVVAACADTPPDEGATLTPPAASLDPASPSTSGSPSTSAADLRLELLADGLVAPVGLGSRAAMATRHSSSTRPVRSACCATASFSITSGWI